MAQKQAMTAEVDYGSAVAVRTSGFDPIRIKGGHSR